MFDEKQLEQYRGVKASTRLEERVMSLEKSGKIYSFNRKAISSVAACLVAVIALGSYFGIEGNVNAELMFEPYGAASLQRSVSEQRVSIKLDVSGGYTVTALSGCIYYGGEQVEVLELDGETVIDWFVPVDGEHVLTVKKGLIIKRYRLYYDAQGCMLEEV